MKNSGYKRENHEIILQSPIPEQQRFIHNIDTSIVNMVDVENYTPTYSGDIPNFNTMDMMELKEFQKNSSQTALDLHNEIQSSKRKKINKVDTPDKIDINVQPQKTE